jgi:hypothetical protein
MLRGPSDLVVLRRPAGSASVLAGPAGAVRSAPPGEPVDADLADLPALLGRLVRVGGVIVAADQTQLTLDDGTARATVRLPAEAAASPAMSAGTAVTLVARVAVASGGAVELELRAMADLAVAGDPDAAQLPGGDPAATAATATPPAGEAAQDGAATLAVQPAVSAGLDAAALLAAAALLLLFARAAWRSPRRVARGTRRRIRDRLRAIAPIAAGGPPGAPPAS